MARLPDETAISAPAIGESGRPISTFDATGYARGAAAIAGGMADLGKGLASGVHNIEAVARQEAKEQDTLEVARARAHFLTKKVELDSSFDADPDYTTYATRYQQGVGTLQKEAAGMISDPRKRELFGLTLADDVARGNARINSVARKKYADADIADVTERLTTIREAALRSTDKDETGKLIQTGNDLIDGLKSRGYIDERGAGKQKREWTENYAIAKIVVLPAEERATILRPHGDVVDRIIGVESGGKATAKNPNSSAYGAGQFIKETWLSVIKETRPDIANWRSDDALLALRADAGLSREMVAAYASKNSAYLRSQGVDASPRNVYLAHFLGPDGAAKVLKAAPGTPVADIVGQDAVKANLSILGGKTAGSVVAWASDKMGGRTGSPVDFIPYDKRVSLYRQAEGEVLQQRTTNGVARGEQIERNLIDATAGRADLLPRSTIENDPLLTEPARNTLLRQHDTATKDVAAYQQVWSKFSNPNGGPFNPLDADERKAVDTLYQGLGGGPKVLQAVVSRTGILPKSAAVAIRGDLISNDPARVQVSLNLSANLLATNPNIFAGVEGKSDLENNAVSFRHYVDDLGMSGDEAAKKIIREQSHEYQASIKAKLKNEDIDAKVRKDLSIDDLAGAFDQVPWIPLTDPNVGFDPATRQSMFSQYAEQVKERYLETGDWSVAKKQAVDTLKRTWGVSRVNGKAVVMPYPPERAPAYAGIENASEVIATNALESIKAESGLDAKRSSLRFISVPGVTAAAYKSGQPVPYILSWQDDKGIVHTLNPGRAFVADPTAIRGAQSETRRKSFEGGRERQDKAPAFIWDKVRDQAKTQAVELSALEPKVRNEKQRKDAALQLQSREFEGMPR